jgi:hypothetical protein
MGPKLQVTTVVPKQLPVSGPEMVALTKVTPVGRLSETIT